MKPARPPLQSPASRSKPRATVKLQPDVDIDLGLQCNLDAATQAAQRERRDGRLQPGMRADVAAPLVEGHRYRDLVCHRLIASAASPGNRCGCAAAQRPDLALIVGALARLVISHRPRD